ncbi:hypothetical protein MXB_4839 [Myxobolus squamalis]|nr:hypothetical protein MXB_4839 [Myxobolus squamalis]
MMALPTYTDSQTGYIYKLIVDEVLKTVRRDIREEIDDHAINLLKIQDKNTVSASMTYAVGTLNQPQKHYPLYYSLATTGSDVRQFANPQNVPNPTYSAPPTSYINKPGFKIASKIRNSCPRKTQEYRNYRYHSLHRITSKETPKDVNVATVSVEPSAPTYDHVEPPSKKQRVNRIVQLDGGVDDLTDTDDEDIYSEEDDKAEGKEKEKQKRFKVDDDFAEIDNEGNLLLFDEPESDVKRSEFIVDSEPLNRDDDISEDDLVANDTENIMICRFEKLIRRKSLWKIDLRHGIATINGADLVFNKAVGDIIF